MEVDRGKRTLICLSSSSDEEEDTEIEADHGKRTLICLSSSSDEEEEETEMEEDDDDEDEKYEEIDEEDRRDSNYSGGGSDCNDDGDREMEDDDDCDDGHDAGDDDESICHRVICLLKDGSDLEVLNLKECKVYLRKHGLRLSEPKEVCIQRIKEHWRLKDRNGEVLYPRSSFVINCTGDACKGDVVLFTQFHKVTRHGGLLGKRTIAGRVVNESYGGAKQQHTFTVEVLWSKSKGLGTLPPLFPLLVKGRNLYRFKTYRQRWDDEAERLKVLSEKHKRGAEARHKRAMKRTRMRPYSKGAKRQKYSNHTVPTTKGKAIETRKTKHLSMLGKAIPQHHQRSRQLNFKRAPRSYATNFSGRSQRFKHHNINDRPTFQPYFRCPKPHQSQMRFYDGRAPFYFSSHDMASNSTMMRLPPLSASVAMATLCRPPTDHWDITIMMTKPADKRPLSFAGMEPK
ncbi:zinc finger CCCH domain-containing protein 62 isoform X2 [Tripterygium wilfordii]|uniref:Zinc finger CCCH domain-containing protein 62 isoform X2 n=1 Tax=Tripterygium wilfordii TaxID=458696 RepID=A0A7J7E2V5_TRIWF|nr:zinc finger CCCH domain-containing protein 62 isoform X2 [Tripterygium wilfordii]